MDGAIYGLLGALIGGAASVLTIFIQQRFQHRRELLKIASDIAQSDWNKRISLISSGTISMPPVSVFVHYHHRVLEEMAKGAFTPEKAAEISREQEALMTAFERYGEEVTERHLASQNNDAR